MPNKKTSNTKYVFVTGGVISGLGKGVSTASTALLLKSAGFRISVIKVDMYLNIDAGTMNPIEHGEVFVTDDGMETDQDLGNYERFLGQTFHRYNYMTMGQIYWTILNKERSLGYKGKTVEGNIHVPEEIINRIIETGKSDNAEAVFIEVGGTVGEYQNIMFFEAIRRFKQERPDDVFLIHLVYLPIPSSLGEMKSKPAQASIYDLYKLGLSPNLVICRGDRPIDDKRKSTISFNTGIRKDSIFSAPNVSTVYKVPQLLKEQGYDNKLMDMMGLRKRTVNLEKWNTFVQRSETSKKHVKVAILGKYFTSGSFSLEDAYICVIEAVKHAAWTLGAIPEIKWFDVERFETPKEKQQIEEELCKFHAIIVPQGWGSRGVEGKIKALNFIRTQKLPFLGLCFGMQMAVIEYARNVLKLKKANTEEADKDSLHPVIHIMPNQVEYLKNNQYGGTIRLGSWPCKLLQGSICDRLYKKYDQEYSKVIKERHRHRYEFNNLYRDQFLKHGLVISGTSPDNKLVEIIELPQSTHPFFVGTQFHPEYKSQPLKPHPLFLGLIEAALKIC